MQSALSKDRKGAKRAGSNVVEGVVVVRRSLADGRLACTAFAEGSLARPTTGTMTTPRLRLLMTG